MIINMMPTRFEGRIQWRMFTLMPYRHGNHIRIMAVPELEPDEEVRLNPRSRKPPIIRKKRPSVNVPVAT